MAEAARCREASPDDDPGAPGAGIRRTLRTIRRVFPGATLTEVRPIALDDVERPVTGPMRRPRRASRRHPFGGPAPMV